MQHRANGTGLAVAALRTAPTPRTMLRTSILLALLCSPTLAQGRIVVAHDEWTFTSQGFTNAPAAGQFAQNVANWFTGGQPGTFRAWSSDMGVSSAQLAAAMTSAGHTWTVSSQGSFNLATLLQYDGVFVVGTPIDANVLAQYVAAGGNVYVAAGTSPSDPGFLNPFLQQFGLSVGALNNLYQAYPISSPHPLFSGVGALFHWNGNSISLTADAGPASQILVAQNGLGFYAIYDGSSGAIAGNLTLGAGCGGLVLKATSRPRLGKDWQLTCTGVPTTASTGVLVFGFSDPQLTDLTSAGLPGCSLHTALDAIVPFAPSGTSYSYQLSIPTTPSLVGFEVFTTVATYLNPPTNPFGAVLANTVRGTLGDV